jgi:CRP-like cAMP-binding protein
MNLRPFSLIFVSPTSTSPTAAAQQEAIDSVYFMNRGIASMLVETDDGRSVEVGVSGREDMIGLPLAARS